MTNVLNGYDTDQLIKALLDMGPSPARHKRIIKEHRKEAPNIWAAIWKIAIMAANAEDTLRLHKLMKETE